MWGRWGAQETDRTDEEWPGRPWVDSPERRSSSRTGFSVVPTAMRSGDAGWGDKEWEYGVQSRLKVCTGVMAAGSRADSLSVQSRDVVSMVEGAGSKGYIDIEVIACVCASSCDNLVTEATDVWTWPSSEPLLSRSHRWIDGSAPPETRNRPS